MPAHSRKVPAQPVVAEADAGFGAGLRLSRRDSRREGFDRVDQSREGFTFVGGALVTPIGCAFRQATACQQNL
jgi:hypothetical protein